MSPRSEVIPVRESAMQGRQPSGEGEVAAFGVRLAQGGPASGCGVVLSGSSAAIPAGTCTILVAPGPNTFCGTAGGQGTLTLPLPIPANQVLVGRPPPCSAAVA